VGPSTGLFDVGGQLVTPPIRGRAGELKVIGALVTALVQGEFTRSSQHSRFERLRRPCRFRRTVFVLGIG